MRYRFVFTDWFNRNLRRLSRRNPHIRADFETFLFTLNADMHPVIPHTGGARKARMKGIGRGKRGGYRVIYYFVNGDTVWLITIYDKVKQEDLSSSEQSRIRQLIREIKKKEF
jgi:mRNA-degrading endonuclease RelE of RelBE toxin-antitoxin system